MLESPVNPELNARQQISNRSDNPSHLIVFDNHKHLTLRPIPHHHNNSAHSARQVFSTIFFSNPGNKPPPKNLIAGLNIFATKP
jgi:hypothetical protein